MRFNWLPSFGLLLQSLVSLRLWLELHRCAIADCWIYGSYRYRNLPVRFVKLVRSRRTHAVAAALEILSRVIHRQVRYSIYIHQCITKHVDIPYSSIDCTFPGAFLVALQFCLVVRRTLLFLIAMVACSGAERASSMYSGNLMETRECGESVVWPYPTANTALYVYIIYV